MYDHLAICVINANKNYGRTKILDNLSISVEKGTIYGLLGASGCGKTTLLNCIIGTRSLDSGEVWTLGLQSGTKDSGIPGPKIGYMPQETALVLEYTVEETIYFFGRIANMTGDAIRNRLVHLSRLLKLPPNKQFVKDCSGGQQRRVSLAGAIVHEPELLILDEPTVGIDSILRDKIWSYLLDEARRGISVIMTTHYIEECRNANKVGLMRNGKLLAEQSPEAIMSVYGTDTLEEAFLTMCLNDEQGIPNPANITITEDIELLKASTSNSMQSFVISDFPSSDDLINKSNVQMKKYHTFLGINIMRLYALLHKNWKQFTRNILGLVLFVVLPITQTLFFLYCIGGDVKDLNLGIINDEVPQKQCVSYDRKLTVIPNITTYDCQFINLSCRFLEYLDNPMINAISYDSTEEAAEEVRYGKIIGFLHIPANFSESYKERVRDVISIDNSTLEFGTIKAYLDMSNKATGGNLKYKLLELFLEFQDGLYKDCLWNERLGRGPVKEEYLYGRKDDSFLIFMLPGLILTFGFYFGTTMASQTIVSEKCEGLWDRSLATGVTTLEIAGAHLLLQLTISIFHGIAPIVISLFLYGIDYQGSVLDMILINVLQNSCGLALGFWISTISKNHTQAHFIVTGLLFPAVLMSGVMWPLEGLPYVLQIVAKCLPSTLPILALRNIIRKGWSMWDVEIVLSNLVTVGWLIVLILLSLLQIKRIH